MNSEPVTYIPHINPSQLNMSPQALVYIPFTLLAYTPEQICTGNKYAPQVPQMWHMPKLLNVHL